MDSDGERGLLGVALDPNFSSNSFVYVYYTATSNPRHNRVSRFTADGDVVVENSEVAILDLDNLGEGNSHNGGAIHFGPDGKLYIAVGENETGSNSQTLTNRLGKILRINSDGSIPTDNPFFNVASGENRSIWALGLRNPFTFAFQPGTARMFVNDVGQNTWEEINDGIAGSNYGWPDTEGATSNPNFRSPLLSYGHGNGATVGCAIAGGAFYNPTTDQFPSNYVGKYFFADLCSGWIRVMDPATNTASGFATNIANPVDLKVGADGSLYYLARGSASIFRVQFPGTQVSPNISLHPVSQSVNEGQPASFEINANGAPPLSYQWQRDAVDIPGANNPTLSIPIALPTDNGAKFRCAVSNPLGSTNSNEAILTVTGNPPVITAQDAGDRAIALDSVTMVREPLPFTPLFDFGTDRRTRIMIFATDAELLPGENSSAITAQFEDQQQEIHAATVEFAGVVDGAGSLTQIVIKFPDGLPTNQDLFVSVNLRGRTSNKARIMLLP